MQRPLSIKKVEGLECAREIGQFKNYIDMRFGMEPDTELYIELEKNQICMLLYSIFGSFNLLEGDKQFKNLTKNTKDKIHNVFKKIVSLKSKHGEFVNRLRLNYNSVYIDQQILEKENSIWNRIAPRSLVKQHENVYFGLTQFDEKWQTPQRQEINKKVLVVPFQNGDKIILCFYQTKKSFSAAQINKNRKGQALFKNKQKSEIIIPHKISEKPDPKLENQKQIMMEGKANIKEVKIPKLYEKVPFAKVYIIFIFFLGLMVFNTYSNSSSIGIHVPATSYQYIFKDGLFKYEKEQIDKFLDSNKLEGDRKLRQFPHYFTNPLHNTTVEINRKHPQLAESVFSFIQESQPIQQKSLQQVVL